MYKFVENKDKTWTGIGLTEEAGKYQGVVYEYGKVSIIENEEKTSATLQFDFNVLDSNGLPKEMIGDDFFKYNSFVTIIKILWFDERQNLSRIWFIVY